MLSPCFTTCFSMCWMQVNVLGNSCAMKQAGVCGGTVMALNSFFRVKDEMLFYGFHCLEEMYCALTSPFCVPAVYLASGCHCPLLTPIPWRFTLDKLSLAQVLYIKCFNYCY